MFLESQKRNELNTNYNVKQLPRFITIVTITTCLLVYIVVSHIFVCVRHRRTRRSIVSESLLEDMYDEIGTISYQTVDISPLPTAQSERVQQFRRIRSLQPESSTSNVNTQLTTDRTFNTSSRLSVQEYQPNALHINNIFGVRNVSPMIATIDIVHIQRRQHSSNSNRQSTISSSSEDSSSGSSGATQIAFNIDEGYENPYQIVIKEGQDSHTYSHLTKQSE